MSHLIYTVIWFEVITISSPILIPFFLPSLIALTGTSGTMSSEVVIVFMPHAQSQEVSIQQFTVVMFTVRFCIYTLLD